MPKIILGTRQSPLALAQSTLIQALLAPYAEVEIKTILTEGDINQEAHYKNSPLSLKGFFTKEIEKALLRKEIDLALHSCKDLPALMPPGLVIAAYSQREDARDTLIGVFKAGAVTGTSSIRREKQLEFLQAGLIAKPIRGNVETRLKKLEEGGYEALLLAAAGLKRLGLQHKITRYFSVEEMIPAPGQGVLALQCRQEDQALIALCKEKAGCTESTWSTEIERGFSSAYGGGCTSPLACYASRKNGMAEVWYMAEFQGQLKRGRLALPDSGAASILEALKKEAEA